MAYPATSCFAELDSTFTLKSGQSVSKAPSNLSDDEQWTEFYTQGPLTCYIANDVSRFSGTNSQDGAYRKAIYLFKHVNDTCGAVLNTRVDQPDLWPLRHYFAYIMLRRNHSANSAVTLDNLQYVETSEAIVKVFEKQLLFDSTHSKEWRATGRDHFLHQVYYWVQMHKPIQHALPAFPCKTTNPDKAPVSMPDGGEYEALETLHQYCRAVERVYRHGCIINIVSDGHVFSDCQGTDDDLVTEYSSRLKAMANVVALRMCLKTGGIRFYDLKQLLVPKDAKSMLEGLELPHTIHPVPTQINPVDDRARALMMSMYSIPPQYFTDLIKSSPNHPITLLYRGFSRFMYQDLENHPSHVRATKSQIKKAGERVALEMVQRNQAYSRVVQCIFPCHVRLSIHGHNNAGPKFAVKLVPLQPLASVTELAITQEDAVKESRQYLHVPTPWHNCVVDIYRGQVSTIAQTMLCKSHLIAEAISSGQWDGGYCRNHPRGGRWIMYASGGIGRADHRRMITATADEASPHIAMDRAYFRLKPNFDLCQDVEEVV